MKKTIRIFSLVTALFFGAASGAWAVDELTHEGTGIKIYVEKTPGDGGTVSINEVTGSEGTSHTVTLEVSPASGYSVSANLITAEPIIVLPTSPSAPRRTPGLMEPLVSHESGNLYSFVLPSDYNAAYVTVTFYYGTITTTKVPIRSLDDITHPEDPTITYEMIGDIDAAGNTSLGDFQATLDGGFHKIYNLSEPLFTSTSGDAIIRNITFEDVSISVSGHAGAVTASAAGNTRIYNCGILPSSIYRDDKGNVTGFSGSSVGSSGGDCGGIVGVLSDNARVINCYSYATITGGNNVGGIVGNNTGTSSQSSITTMVMNCMFYGDITGGSTVSPVYGGNNIDNTFGGLATYNYYAYSQLKSKTIENANYHCTLGAEERYLVRDVLYRQLLNSNKKLAAKYASTTSTTVYPKDMAKWVLETADRQNSNPMPYPVLKEQEKYPSIINIDAEHATTTIERNKGGLLGTLDVTIQQGSGAPEGATITTPSLTLNRTDKDFDRYNFNYDKVQLPYYNDVGTKNYTGNKVVTGWIITDIVDGTPGTFTEADAWGGYNFADRKCTNKDLYSVSHRVFSQGAYFDVPYGVTGITIKPYWGEAVYVSDQFYDVVYQQVGTDMKNNYSPQNVEGLGTQNTNDNKISINDDEQKVYTSIGTARGKLTFNSGETVYDNAVVLVGNVHQAGPLYGSSDTPYSIMSVDLDKDNEPDYSFIFSHYNRQPVSSIRFDFLNVIGTAEAQKPNGADQLLNVSIFNPLGWFELTNTCTIHITQFEADNSNVKIGNAYSTKNAAPVILLGGMIDQYTSTKDTEVDKNNTTKTIYIHLGSNVCFKEFGNGTHSDGWNFTRHVPVSVTGGDFEGFYLSGVYRPDAKVKADDAEGYISGGRFTEVAGAAQQMIDGNVHWQIYDADITNFYGGGINADRPITGNVTTDIINSHVGTFCGGPKFGDMQEAGTQLHIICSGDKAGTEANKVTYNIDIAEDGIVTTNATGCTFGTFFGAGYGGASSFKLKYYDETSPKFNTYIGKYNSDRGLYFDGNDTNFKSTYGNKGPGVATEFDYEFFVWSSGAVGARFYVNYTSFSLAKTKDVNSTLTNCTVENNFYGGGSLGMVDGSITSKLDGCTVNGNVYGSGFSASIPFVPVRDIGFKKTPGFNVYAGIFDMGEKNGEQKYKWKKGTLTKNTSALDGTDIITDQELSSLGVVNGNATLNIEGTTITGNVYGGGESSAATGNVNVNISGGTMTNVYGGGDEGAVGGNCVVTLSGSATVNGNVYGGGNEGEVSGSTEVNIKE